MKKIIRIIMIILTLIYPLFMNLMAGMGLIYNKNSYGGKIVTAGIFLIISGIMVTIGDFLCISSKKITNIVSLTCNISGLVICLVMLYIICTHADNAGWADNYTMAPVSGMYKARILPVIIPSVLSAGLAIANINNINKNRTS